MADVWTAAVVAGGAITGITGFLTFIVKVAATRAGPFSGTWTSTYETKEKVVINEELRLRGLPMFSLVWGASRCHWTVDGKRTNEEYRIRGLNRGKMLCGAYLTSDARNHEIGVFIVRQSEDGKTAEGTITSYEKADKPHLDRKSLQPVDYHWTRISR